MSRRSILNPKTEKKTVAEKERWQACDRGIDSVLQSAVRSFAVDTAVNIMDVLWVARFIFFWLAISVHLAVSRPQQMPRKPRISLDPVVAKGLKESFRRSVSPFSRISLGKDHCSPFNMYLKACETCGYQIEIVAQTDVIPLIHHIVDMGTLKLGVIPPGFSTNEQLMILVTVPLNATLTEVSG
eukprot:2508886-Pyramimonas_sp.AAC.2